MSTLERAKRHRTVQVPIALGLLALCCGGGVEKEQAGPPNGGSTSSGGSAAVVGGDQAAGSPESGGSAAAGPKAVRNTNRDVLSTHIALNVGTQTGVATIELAPSPLNEGATLEVGDLTIRSVTGESGKLDFALGMSSNGAVLDVGLAASASAQVLEVTYDFNSHERFDGWSTGAGTSFLWPYYCGNLFPCRSTPADGVKFSMSVTGYPAGLTALFPASLETDAPSYMPAVTVGELRQIPLGETTNGTKLSAWLRPGQDAGAATQGTSTLMRVFDFYEQTYGAYAFGDEAGSVAVDWGGSGFRGMEHHPYWHINQNNFADAVVHAHEAAHGWFGNGVRLECWEDFVLSEGTASYLAARAMEQVGVDVWPEYECRVLRVCQHVVLKKRCSGVDILTDPIGSAASYMKGAFFFRDVEDLIGAEELDAALAEFYAAHVGKASSFDALLDVIRARAGGDGRIDELVASWLQSSSCPSDTDSFCAPSL